MEWPTYTEYPVNEPFPQPQRNRPLLSSLPLHQSLYFNFFFSCVYAVLQILLIIYKFRNYNEWRISYVTPIVLVVFLLLEPYRLYLGWQGNLKERVPQLAAFVFLTAFLGLIVCIYNMAIQYPLLSIDKALGWVYAVFSVFGLLFGLFATRHLVRHKTNRFNVEHYGVVSPDYDVDAPDLTDDMEALLAERQDALRRDADAARRRRRRAAAAAALAQQQQRTRTGETDDEDDDDDEEGGGNGVFGRRGRPRARGRTGPSLATTRDRAGLPAAPGPKKSIWSRVFGGGGGAAEDEDEEPASRGVGTGMQAPLQVPPPRRGLSGAASGAAPGAVDPSAAGTAASAAAAAAAAGEGPALGTAPAGAAAWSGALPGVDAAGEAARAAAAASRAWGMLPPPMEVPQQQQQPLAGGGADETAAVGAGAGAGEEVEMAPLAAAVAAQPGDGGNAGAGGDSVD
jgi:hypothetical protein